MATVGRRFWVNLNNGIVSDSLTVQSQIQRLNLKTRDAALVGFQFHRDGIPELLTGGSTICYGLKAKNDFGNVAFLASISSFTNATTTNSTAKTFADTDFYRGSLNLNTAGLTDLLGDNTPEVEVISEVEVDVGGGGSPWSSNTITTIVRNDVCRGSEGVPVGGSPPYPGVDEVIRNKSNGDPSAISSLIGNTSTDFDSVATAALTTGTEDAIIDEDAADIFRLYRLEAGAVTETTATADAGTDIVTATAHGLVSNDRIQFFTSGTLPAGLSLDTVYFAGTITTNTFQVFSATGPTTLVDITDTGTGTHTVYKLLDPTEIRPSDYDSATNIRTWQQKISSAAPSGVLLADGTVPGTAIQELLGLNLTDATTLTLSTGATTATQGIHVIAAETGTTDDFDTLTPAKGSGDVVYFWADTGDTITLKHGTGNFVTGDGNDISFGANDLIVGVFDGTNFHVRADAAGLLANGSVAGMAMQELLGLNLTDSTILTLSTGAATITQSLHAIAAESGTTDDIDTLTAAKGSGDLLILWADIGDTITLKHGTGNIVTGDGSDIAFTADDLIILVYDGTNWHVRADATGGGGGLTWSVEAGPSKTMVANEGYFAQDATLLTFTLPATATLGDTYKIAGIAIGGWKIAQNASDTIVFGDQDTTVGTGGSLASTQFNDVIEIVAVATNQYVVVNSLGNITVV